MHNSCIKISYFLRLLINVSAIFVHSSQIKNTWKMMKNALEINESENVMLDILSGNHLEI